MLPDFLPPSVAELTEPSSIQMAHAIQRQLIDTTLCLSPIQTTFTHQGNSSEHAPMLLLHGFDSSVLEFRRLLPLLTSAQQEVWAIDLLGFGFTDRPTNLPITPEAIKTHLYSSWKTLIERPIVLVGASMGGAAAIDLALTYPDIVKALILLDGAVFSGGPTLGKFLFPPLDYWAVNYLRQPGVRDRISRTAYANPAFASADAAVCAALHLDCPGWHRAMISFTKSGGYGFSTEQVAPVKVPTLILWGQNDRILGTANAERLHQTIEDSELVWLDNCGHVPHLEKPDLTAQQMIRFIQRLPP